MKSTPVLIVAVCLSVAPMLAAQERDPGNTGMRFQSMDTNGDGAISRDEWAAAFERLDANHDGRLSPRELETADSGYEPRIGSHEEYQAGYRAGFRLGYHEGFGPR